MVATNGSIHGLFNNAGGQFPSPAASLSAKGFDVVVRNNLTGGFVVSREVYTQSMQRHGGSIVNMAADFRNGFPNMAHTGAARAGMVNLTMTLAYEWAVAGVRVNAVSPGWIASSGMDTYTGEFKEQIPKLKGYCPLGRLGTESEVSAAVCFLLSDAAAYITGTELRIDGGVPLGNRSIDLPATDKSQPFNGFQLARTPKVLGGE
jgi:citronellol/citronellal dehydrogenase